MTPPNPTQSDLVERLRAYRHMDEWGEPWRHEICDEAAAEIERLQSLLKDSHEPFGYFVEHVSAEPAFLRPPAYIPPDGGNYRVTPLYANPHCHKIESHMDGGRFEEWPTETFVGQLRMQSRDSLDPEYSQFMAAAATHLGILSGQYDAQREIAERMKEETARLRAHCEAMSKALETYTSGYLLDEREQPGLCWDDQHYQAIVALFDCLEDYRGERGA